MSVSTVGKRKRRKRPSSSSSSSSSFQSAIQHVAPDSDPIFWLAPAAHRSTTYYTGIRVLFQSSSSSSNHNSNHNHNRCYDSIRVGQVLAIACSQSRPSPQERAVFPNTPRWSPAQVLALYQHQQQQRPTHPDDGQHTAVCWNMTVRWFYRKGELPEHQLFELQETMSSPSSSVDHPHHHYNHHHHESRHTLLPPHVYEHDHVDENIHVHTIVGRVHWVSSSSSLSLMEGNSDSPQHHHHDTTGGGMPHVTLQCTARFQGEEESVQKVQDWERMDPLPPCTNRSTLPDPILRGLACLHNKALVQVTQEALVELQQPSQQTESLVDVGVKGEEQSFSSNSEQDELNVETVGESVHGSESDDDDDESEDEKLLETNHDDDDDDDDVVVIDDSSEDNVELAAPQEPENDNRVVEQQISPARPGGDLDYECDVGVAATLLLAESDSDDEMESMRARGEFSIGANSLSGNDAASIVADDESYAGAQSRTGDSESNHVVLMVADDESSDGASIQAANSNSDCVIQSAVDDSSSVEDELTFSESVDCDSVVDKEMTFSSRVLKHSVSPNRTYFECISVAIRREACAPRVVNKARSRDRWEVRVGDIVCLQYDEATRREDHILAKLKKKSSKQAQLWFPFVVPWVVCQVVTIYRDKHAGNRVMLEVRWFYRKSTFPHFVQARMEGQVDTSMEEIFETDNVETGLPATLILGHVNLFLGPHTTAGNISTNSSVPSIQCRCSQFYVTQESVFQLQPIFCSGLSPQSWYSRAVVRGGRLSKNVQVDNVLHRSVEEVLEAIAGEADTMPFAHIGPKDTKDTVQFEPEYGNAARLCIEPPWDRFCLSDTLWHTEDRDTWDLSVGDLVAIEDEEATAPSFQRRGGRMWYPFNVSWSPAQVLAIFETDKDAPKVEIRWFHRASGSPEDGPFNKQVLNRTAKLKVEAVYEMRDCETEVVGMHSLLGPLTILSQNDNQVGCAPSYLPQAPLLYGGLYNEASGKAKLARMWSWRDVVARGLDCASHYDDENERNSMMSFLFSEDASPFEGSNGPSVDSVASPSAPNKSRRSADHATPRKRVRLSPCEGDGVVDVDNSGSRDAHPDNLLDPDDIQVWTSVPPFHIDVSTRRAYYSELNVSPPYKHYAVGRSRVQNADDRDCWKVKLGDPVILEYDVGAGRANFDPAEPNQNAHFPLKSPWAIGEIVTVWKQYDNADELDGLDVLNDEPGPRHEENTMVEIRWFYRRDELLGASRSQRKTIHVSGTLEEVFESDHVEKDWKATSIRAPAVVHSTPVPIGASQRYFKGMPVIRVYCSRFYSLHRKSMIPCGGSSGRIERGRLLSKHFGTNSLLKTALDEKRRPIDDFTSNATENDRREPNVWRLPFQQAIARLSLSDAADDAAAKGRSLPGREKEMEKIKNFLRKAICDRSSTDDIEGAGSAKSSMFVAGPPGTGKTASVRSIIAQLRHEQVSGDIPSFEFIALNGMEMRHPFEAYVRLWEEVSGVAREKKPLEVAAALLEKYFTGNRDYDASEDEDERIIVVLLDEIDYLVTRKQSVLYNFFDWPIRASETPRGPRLIVIGISNTLNLPSRLKPSVQSRLGKERCDFKAYNHQDIVKILVTKIKPESENSYKVFDDDAIVFAARKTASLSGDLRKALQLCKVAAENVLKAAEIGTWVDPVKKTDLPIVRLKAVHTASRESFGSILPKALTMTSPFEALLLISLGSLSRSTGRENGGFDIDELLTKIEAIANASGSPLYLPPPSFSEILELLNRLGELRLVSLSTPKSSAVSFRAAQGGSGGAWPLIALPMDSSTIMVALRDTPHSTLASKYLGTDGW